MGARAESASARTERPAGPGARRRSDAGRRLRRAAAGGAVDGAVALPRPRGQRRAHSAGADREPVPRRRTHRELPARTAPQGAAHAAGQPAHRRRRRPRQDRRSGLDPHRAAVAAPYPAGPGAHAGLVASTVAGRAVGEVRTAVRGGRPARDGAPAARARHGRHALALVQPHRRLVSLPAAARRTGAVRGRLPYAGRLAASSLGSADRRRVPQPDALALRRGQRAVPHVAAGCPAVRAPPLRLRHAPQRAHALVHGAPGDARPRAFLPHQRDGPRHAGEDRGRGGPPAEARHQRPEHDAALLHPASAKGRQRDLFE